MQMQFVCLGTLNHWTEMEWFFGVALGIGGGTLTLVKDYIYCVLVGH